MTDMGRRAWWSLVALGLVLRLPGLLFGGMADVYEFILDWGGDVRSLGLAEGFSINYGALSFAAFGVAAWLGEQVPRFWWAPYKVIVIALDAAVLAALVRVAGRSAARLILFAYWLNPWFIWHGAFQGFWDSAHLWMGLLAVLACRDARLGRAGWAAAGALLFLSWQFKPQGLVHFAVPVGLLLALWAVRGVRRPLLTYSAGFLVLFAVTSLLFLSAGGSAWAVLDNFRSSSGDMRLSNGGVGLWRFVSLLYMRANGLAGEVHTVRMPLPLLALGASVTAAVSGGLLLALAVRLGRRALFSWSDVYLMMTAGALVVAQFGPRAHINHTYGALVLLVPLIGQNRWLRIGWLGAVGIQAVAHLSRYGMGAAALLPPEAVIERYGHAGAIADGVRSLPAFTAPDAMLRFQQWVNDVLAILPGPDAVSVLGLPMAVCAAALVVGLFRLAGESPDRWAARAEVRVS